MKRGRDGVRETGPVRPAPDAHVTAVLPVVPGPLRAMIELQRLTSMRPGEVTVMRGADLDRSGDVRLYEPGRHKPDHLGQHHAIFLGRWAQRVLEPCLKEDPQPDLFSPITALEARNASRRAERKTP